MLSVHQKLRSRNSLIKCSFLVYDCSVRVILLFYFNAYIMQRQVGLQVRGARAKSMGAKI